MAPPPETFSTPITKLLGIKYPVLLAGMNAVAGADLAAAVTNCGGLGVVGGVGYTPDILRKVLTDLKAQLKDKNAPFGVDLLLPQVGGSARATNTDYTGGQLPELIDIIIQEKAALFVCAVGVPPTWAVEKLHAAGIPVMNMIGSTRHVPKCIAAGCDIICAQGTEGGGHTGAIATSVLIPQVVDLCKGHKSNLTGEDIHVIAAGGIFDGRGLAMALCLGAKAVWVGTRFICAKEAACPPRHQNAVLKASSEDTVRTIIYTGRPMRVLSTPYIQDWENNRQHDINNLTKQGILPVKHDVEAKLESGELTPGDVLSVRPLLMGQAVGPIHQVTPAADIVYDMVRGATQALRGAQGLVARL